MTILGCDTKASLNLTECFNPFDTEAIPDCRLLDNFSNYISFHSYNCLSLSSYKLYLYFLDYLCFEASFSFSTLIVITDASALPTMNI